MGENIESKVADTLLQRGETIVIGGETFEVAPPTVATLILVSEEIAMLPQIDKTDDDTLILDWVLINAKDCGFLGDIISILILGANDLTEKVIEKKRFLGITIKKKEVVINHQKRLADILLRYKSPKELNELTAQLLSSMEIGDFFGLTTSLTEINLTKPTREVGTIVSGQQ